MLGRVRESSGVADEVREEGFDLGGEAGVAISDVYMVEHVAEEIQQVKALALGRELTGASGGSEGDREGLGQSSQVLPQGGDADRGVNQMLQYPLFAFLEVGRRKKKEF